MSKPRAMTQEEMADAFIEHVRAMIDWWDKETRVRNTRERIEGAVFSVLAAIDGDSAALPGFKLVPDPHEDDKKFHRDRGENWWPADVDIAGDLHERLVRK